MTASDQGVERIRIPNRVAHSPVALPDVMLAAPLLSRLLLGASGPGLAIQAAALGAYAGSAAKDWIRRLGVRKIDFLAVFGADVGHLPAMPLAARRSEIAVYARRVNELYRPIEMPRDELAARVNEALTRYIAGITGQRVETSDAIRSFMLAQFFFPFALGGCDFISGDVAIFRDTGVFEPHVIAHEFSHRKGYFKELEAQALAYLSLEASDDPLLVQSAFCERLHRQLRVVARKEAGSGAAGEDHYHDLVDRADLRPELRWAFHALVPRLSSAERAMTTVMRRLYDERMRLTGQNGITDYDEGFTRFLYGFENGGA
ncbi:MAG: DUF3810 family protein [Gemmatimonadota bacterium]|nr:MAG: DUF3810 family protein [Gemmatimonadota bacterium]